MRDGLTSGLTACPRYCSICQPIRRRHVAVDHLSPAPIDSTCMAPKRHDSQNPGGGRWEEIKAPAGQKQIHCLAGRGEPPHCRVDRGVTRSIHWTATRSNLSMGPPTPIRQYIRSPVLISDLSGDCANQPPHCASRDSSLHWGRSLAACGPWNPCGRRTTRSRKLLGQGRHRPRPSAGRLRYYQYYRPFAPCSPQGSDCSG